MRSILLLAVAATLTGCTISTELGPGGFQGGRYSDGSVTGSKISPAAETAPAGAQAPAEGVKAKGDGGAPAAAKG